MRNTSVGTHMHRKKKLAMRPIPEKARKASLQCRYGKPGRPGRYVDHQVCLKTGVPNALLLPKL